MELRKKIQHAKDLLLLVGVLLRYAGCVPHSIEDAFQGQKATSKTKNTIKKALPDSLIDQVKNNDLERYLRSFNENLTQKE